MFLIQAITYFTLELSPILRMKRWKYIFHKMKNKKTNPLWGIFQIRKLLLYQYILYLIFTQLWYIIFL